MTSDFLAGLEALIVSPEFIAHPYPALQKMRAEAPVYWSDAVGGWVLTRYDDIIVSFKDTAHYSNENRLGQAIAYLPAEKRAQFQPFADHYKIKSILHSDPPDHTRLRAVVTKDFTPALVERFRPRIQEVVDHLLDQVAATGRMDVVSDLAAPLPIGVIAEILGVPAPDRHLFQVWADALLSFQGVNKPSEADLARAQQAIMEMRPYIASMMAERRVTPRDDLMSKFVATEADGGKVEEREMISTCVTLFVAGHETSLSLIANTLYLLLAHPDQLRLLRENPELLSSTIEESLRFESPVSRQPRRMKGDVELGGQHLRQGQMAFQMLNSANRDPAYFAEAETFDIRRQKNRHLAFGHGHHFCVGAALARVEAAVTIGTVLRRLPRLRLAHPEPDWDVTKRNSRVLKSLPVLF